ncbi:GGDEF domain-containing protein [Cohnella herbarum]|uniref:GGDEF domain-containing protein n=1 Tax=Cohnella herbarum TaxID=2728023 RepID=A0A7Z2ZLI3_9BACL|nr:GGDEF domain-containing protein [Cohnella herbarum]QJD83929.1 GGDEF domain-containing protein [Cohnella herbarum]
MNETNGWLDQNILRRWTNKDGLPHHCGLFIVRYYGGQESGPERKDNPSPRLANILRAIALRVSKIEEQVRGWTLSETGFVLAVSFMEDGANEREISAGRLAFLIRDTAQRVLLDFRCPEAKQAGVIRCGFGWAFGGADATSERPPTHAGDWENALLGAYEAAWQKMFFSPVPMIRFPLAEAYETLTGLEFEVRYSPIVSLSDGSLYGYEAVPVDPAKGTRIDPQAIYAQADQTGKLFEWDRRFRETAIRGLPSRNGDVKLFLPVPAKIIFDPRLYPGSTLRRIEAANLRPEHVVLVIIGGDNESAAMTESALKHYRNQGFHIALSGIEPGLESLRRMADMHPDYALMHIGWMSGSATDPVEESLLQALVGVARKERIVFIACGPDLEKHLPGLVAGGMNYAQVNWLRDGSGEKTAKLLSALKERIQAEVNKKFLGATGTMSELINPVKQFDRDTPVSEVSRHFELHREAQGIVIADGSGKPVGLVMKEKLLQLLSGQFGLPLYWNRAVGKIMDTHPMVVEDSITVDQASQMAMAREPDKLYDAVIITREGIVTGITSIRSMLEWISQSRMTAAQWANPLSGLPGNEPIRRELIRRLADGRPFAVLYADLDYFKWYNDQYGFQRGDEVIRFTGETLIEVVSAQLNCECFVGHIGGDDFIVISSGSDSVELANEVIRRFEEGIGTYTGKHKGPVLDRGGHPVEASGLSLSLSLLLCQSTGGWTPESLSERAALLKKKAKQLRGNTLVWEAIADNVENRRKSADLTAH